MKQKAISNKPEAMIVNYNYYVNKTLQAITFAVDRGHLNTTIEIDSAWPEVPEQIYNELKSAGYKLERETFKSSSKNVFKISWE